MNPRFICPHCHSPLDPRTMDQAGDAQSQLRVCPNCDEPVVLAAVLAAELAAFLPATTVGAGKATTSPGLAGNARR